MDFDDAAIGDAMSDHDDRDDDCPECGGDGDVHDCGEDTCPCADPETQDRVTCPSCNGRGR